MMRDLRWAALARHVAIPLGSALVVLSAAPAFAASTATLIGDFQDQLGCSKFDAACALSDLTFDDEDQLWQGAFALSGGQYGYAVAMDRNFDERYGAHGLYASDFSYFAGLTLAETQTVKFYFDLQTRWLTDNVNSAIAVLAGNFQDELGCGTDWKPDCLRSWLQDVDGDGIYTFSTTLLPPGDYSTVVAMDESFALTYGAGGQAHGELINFTVGAAPVLFTYDSATHVLQVDTRGAMAVPEPQVWALMIAGFGLAGAGLRRRRQVA